MVDGGFALSKAGPTREVKPARPRSWLDFENRTGQQQRPSDVVATA